MAAIRWTVLFSVLWLVRTFPVENGSPMKQHLDPAPLSAEVKGVSGLELPAMKPEQIQLEDDGDSGTLLEFSAKLGEIGLHTSITTCLLLLFYGIIIIVSLVGNILVCRVLLCAKRSAYPTLNISTGTGTSKILIVNLAVSDLLLTMLNIPINLVRFISRDWIFGEFICGLMPFVQSVSAYCSAWTMLVIAFERYRKIIQQRTFHLMQQKKSITAGANETSDQPQQLASGTARRSMEITLTTGQHQHVLLGKLNPNLWVSIGRHLQLLYSRLCYSFCAGCCCCCPETMLPTPPSSGYYCGSSQCSRRFPAWVILSAVWLVSLLFSYPHSLYAQVTHYDYATFAMTRCTINNFPDQKTRIHLTLYTFITQYLLPIGITTYCYLHIGIFLWRRETVGALSEGRRLFLLQRKRRRVRMLIFVVFCFAVCWLPLNLYIIATDYGVIFHHQLIFFCVHWFAMSSVCYNPFIYCWLNEAFRTKAKSMLMCFVPSVCWKVLTGRQISSHIPSVSERLKNGRRCSRRHDAPFANGLHPEGAEKSVSWSSTTMSATGKQQAISELISMSALLEQDLLDSSKRYTHANTSNRNFPYSKEQRLALMTTQSGRRRHHSHQLIMMLKMNEDEPTTKTTSINLVSSPSSSSSSSIEMVSTKLAANGGEPEQGHSGSNSELSRAN